MSGACGTHLALGATAILLAIVGAADAANTPCNGRKGGIAGCQGDTFICNDGSVSASKRACSAYTGGAVGLLSGAGSHMAPTVSGE